MRGFKCASKEDQPGRVAPEDLRAEFHDEAGELSETFIIQLTRVEK